MHHVTRPGPSRFLLLIILAITMPLWAVPLPGQPQHGPSEKEEEGFVDLFDGKTLKGWKRHDGLPEEHSGGHWEVVDGAITGEQDPPGRGGLLITTRKYRDFVLRLEMNIDFSIDSGIFLRVGETGKSHQVGLDNRGGGQIGCIYLPWTQGMVMENHEGMRYFKSGEWQDVEIRIEGEPARIQFRLDGHLVTDFQHTEETTRGNPSLGYIGLQVHPGGEWIEGSKVRFRNIRIKEL